MEEKQIILKPDDRINCSGVSLHDAHFHKIRIEEDKLIFDFNTLYLVDGEEEIWKSGSIVFEKVDLEFCDVMIYRESHRGKIRGKRYSFEEFAAKYSEYDFEVLDEGYYGYKVKWDGYAYMKDRMDQFHISIFHLGDMIYQLN